MTEVVAVTGVVVAANVPVALPAAIVKLAGTVTDAELLPRLINAPPEPAPADKVTVHVLEVPPTTAAGTQVSEEIVTAGIIEYSYAPIDGGLGRVFHWMSIEGAPVAVPAPIAGEEAERWKSNKFCVVL